MRKRAVLCGIKRDDRPMSRSSRLTAPIRNIVLTLCVLSLSGCVDRHEGKESSSDVLLTLDGISLTMREVTSHIPVGIDAADSAAMFRAITDNWIKTRVLSDLAENKLADVSHIDRQVEAYRNRLIVAEYLRRMKEGKHFDINPDSIMKFYDAHKKELLTEMPLVKGVYIKVASSTIGLNEIRQLMSDASDESIDRLEKSWLDAALQYDYFGNKWIDWQTIANQIPYRFSNPDAFLSTTRDFETTYNGSTYILHICDYLPTGSEQPYEFSADRIARMMERAKMADYEQSLVNSLVKKAIDEGRMEITGYDPFLHEVIGNPTIKAKNNLEDEKK